MNTSIPEISSRYLPLMTSVKYTVSEMSKIHENAECNKEICSIMMKLVRKAEIEMNLMIIDMNDNMKNIIQNNYYASFKSFKIILSNIREYIKNVSTLRGYKKYLSAKEVRNKFNNLINEYNNCIERLQFTQFALKTVDEINGNSDVEKVDKDINEVEDTLQNITCKDNRSIDAIVQEVSIIRIQTAKQQGDVRAQRINSSELKDLLIPLENHRGRIVKKLYNDSEVACKPIGDYKNQESDLTILGKLQSEYILRFYGLSSVDNLKVIVLEWTNNGTLKELYNTYIIPWTRKLQIVRDICRGIISSDLVPKLGNFRCTREVNVRAKNLSGLVTDVIRWMAPEQLERYEKYRRDENTYTFSCEMFSFGMLIWELCYEKMPYENLEIKEISDHVISAWHHKPHQRISLAGLHLTLEKLVENFPIPFDTPIPLQDKISKLEEAMDVDSPSVDFLIPLEKGVELHKNRDHKAALECFEENAKLGDPLAKYWLGYYLSYGYDVIEIDKERAKNLFKEAADHDHSDAQCRYAVALLSDLKKDDPESKKEENRNEIIHYFKLAANNKNPNAMYYLADIYINGKLKVQSDKELGMMYLKLAADHNYEKAVNLLKQLNDAKKDAENDGKNVVKNDVKNDINKDVKTEIMNGVVNGVTNKVENDKVGNEKAGNDKVENDKIKNDKVESDKVKNEIKNEVMNENKSEEKSEAMNEEKSVAMSEEKSVAMNEDKGEDKSEEKSEAMNEDKSEEKMNEDKSEEKSEAMNEDKSEEKSEAMNEDRSKSEMISDTNEVKNGDKNKVINKDENGVKNEIMNEDRSDVMSIDNYEVINEDKNKEMNDDKQENMDEDRTGFGNQNLNYCSKTHFGHGGSGIKRSNL
ncbi:7086_t:CDS:2, partial [Dentiscutata heterogama]